MNNFLSSFISSLASSLKKLIPGFLLIAAASATLLLVGAEGRPEEEELNRAGV